MSGRDRDSLVNDFEARLREWGGRPPSRDAAVAANRVLGALPDRDRGLPWLRLAAAAALLVVVTVVSWLATPAPPRAQEAAVAGAEAGDVVRFWLDSGTQVHFVLPQFGEGKGETS